jgi:translation initiation factor 2 gamma subunit (eIF-2gamma)
MLEKNNKMKIQKIEFTKLDLIKLEKALTDYCLCKELLEYKDSDNIPVFPILKKIRRKLGIVNKDGTKKII